jgi:hypothetical protein
MQAHSKVDNTCHPLWDVSVILIGVLLVIEEEIVVSGWPAQKIINSEKTTRTMKIERDLMVVPKVILG